MSKERLEEIKTSTWNICECETCYCENFKPQMIAVEPKHFDWLIEQAERAQELEETNKKNYWIAADFKFENLQLEQQNQRLKQALEQINQLGWSDDFGGGHNYMAEYHAQAIKISEKALEREARWERGL